MEAAWLVTPAGSRPLLPLARLPCGCSAPPPAPVPPTRAKPPVSYFTEKTPSFQGQRPGECLPQGVGGLGRNQGGCAAGGRGEGLPLSRPRPRPSRLCAPSLTASCAETATETQAGHGSPAGVPTPDRSPGSCGKGSQIACRTAETWRFSSSRWQESMQDCKQRYKIL